MTFAKAKGFASVAQSVEQRTENPRVDGSIPSGGTNFQICGFSSFGRAPPCQGGGSEFEPRNPLQKFVEVVISAFLFYIILLTKLKKWYTILLSKRI